MNTKAFAAEEFATVATNSHVQQAIRLVDAIRTGASACAKCGGRAIAAITFADGPLPVCRVHRDSAHLDRQLARSCADRARGRR